MTRPRARVVTVVGFPHGCDTTKVKASGGIRTLADARAMIKAGANRLGTSASAAILAAVESDN